MRQDETSRWTAFRANEMWPLSHVPLLPSAGSQATTAPAGCCASKIYVASGRCQVAGRGVTAKGSQRRGHSEVVSATSVLRVPLQRLYKSSVSLALPCQGTRIRKTPFCGLYQ
jgi:hypothetical protein